jgi:hypothetical protein
LIESRPLLINDLTVSESVPKIRDPASINELLIEEIEEPKVGVPKFLLFSKMVGSSPFDTGPVLNSDFFCSFM